MMVWYREDEEEWEAEQSRWSASPVDNELLVITCCLLVEPADSALARLISDRSMVSLARLINDWSMTSLAEPKLRAMRCLSRASSRDMRLPLALAIRPPPLAMDLRRPTCRSDTIIT